jgi:hypothetical protein
MMAQAIKTRMDQPPLFPSILDTIIKVFSRGSCDTSDTQFRKLHREETPVEAEPPSVFWLPLGRALGVAAGTGKPVR